MRTAGVCPVCRSLRLLSTKELILTHRLQVVPWTIIKRWYEEGKFVPYSSEQMVDLLMQVKSRVHPWIRLNRVVRDIPIQVRAIDVQRS